MKLREVSAVGVVPRDDAAGLREAPSCGANHSPTGSVTSLLLTSYCNMPLCKQFLNQLAQSRSTKEPTVQFMMDSDVNSDHDVELMKSDSYEKQLANNNSFIMDVLRKFTNHSIQPVDGDVNAPHSDKINSTNLEPSGYNRTTMVPHDVTNGTLTIANTERWLISEFQMIKAIVLVAVLSLVLLSTGRLVLKSFARTGGPSKDHA